MSPSPKSPRRRALATLSTLVVGAVILTTELIGGSAGHAAPASSAGKLPVKQIETIEQAQGDYSDGVLSIDIDRDHHLPTAPGGVAFKPGFEIMHELYFQMISANTAIFNGDVAVRASQTNHVIDTIEANHLVFQAEHQHFTDIHPLWWFIHFRGTGTPNDLAQRVHNVVLATHVKLPQTMPKHPTTPLPAKRLGKILGGQETVGENGIVTVDVSRTDTIRLGGHTISPDLGVSTEVSFQPVGHHDRAAAVPDFSMTSSEVGPVVRTMRRHHWDVECLYNQETAESPQLFFSHMYKVGDAKTLAHQLRKALDHTMAEK